MAYLILHKYPKFKKVSGILHITEEPINNNSHALVLLYMYRRIEERKGTLTT